MGRLSFGLGKCRSFFRLDKISYKGTSYSSHLTLLFQIQFFYISFPLHLLLLAVNPKGKRIKGFQSPIKAKSWADTFTSDCWKFIVKGLHTHHVTLAKMNLNICKNILKKIILQRIFLFKVKTS